MPPIASIVRSSGSSWISPSASWPSPSRLTSARSAIRRQVPSGARSATWNFTELVPQSMTAYRSGAPPSSHARPGRVGGVGVGAQADLANALGDRGAVGRLDRDRPGGDAVRHDVAHLGRAAVDRVPDAALVDVDRAHARPRHGELADQLLGRVAVAGERRGLGAEQAPHVPDGGDVDRQLGLHRRHPLLEPGAVRLHELLHVHQAGPDLDGGHGRAGRLGQEVGLVALLDAGRLERGDMRRRHLDARAERAPLPARNDGHGDSLCRCRAPSRVAADRSVRAIAHPRLVRAG